jgi:serine/threonine protein kinase
MMADNIREPRQCVGKYELLEKIADGGMGSVHRARDQTSGEVVAVKILGIQARLDREVVLKRFEQEFRVARTLEHPHLVRALDFGVEGDLPYLVMEYVDGGTLTDRIESEGPLAEHVAISLITQVAQALDLAHARGLIHRDIKPDNVLLTASGIAKLADLGLAKESSAHLNLTRTGTGLGTPNFMAPEQLHDAKQADARSDIYALAATLYMAVTGTLPFCDGNLVEAWMKKVNNALPPPRQLASGVSERVDWAIRRGMSADPSQRPASCRQFVEDLTGNIVRREMPGVLVAEPPREQWYLIYSDRNGTTHKAKGSVTSVRQLLQGQLLHKARRIWVGTSESGPFDPLSVHTEYRDLVIEPAPLPPAQPRQHDQVMPVACKQDEALRLVPRRGSSRRLIGAVGGQTPTSAGDSAGLSRVWTWLSVIVLALGSFLAGLWFLPK